MQELPITDHHVTGITDNWYRALKALAAGFGDQRFDIELALLVGAREHPDTVHRSAAIHLGHEIKAVNVLIKVRAVPMGDPILMPGNRCTDAGLFDKQCLIEGREVWAINRLGHPE